MKHAEKRTVEFECIVPEDEDCALGVVNAESGDCNNEDGFLYFSV